MQNELDVIRDIAEKFAQAGIEYMVTGSVAMNYYTQPRMTRDIDVVVALKPKDVDMVTALFQSDYYVVSVWIVSKEDLIISKLYWARDSHSEFQLRDVKNLLVSGYDVAYLEQWTRELGLYDLLQECLI